MINKRYRKLLIALLWVAGAGFVGAFNYAATYTITVDGGVKLGTVPHFWSECVGTGTMSYCLKPAWQTAARIGVQEAGFKRVRGHGILIQVTGVDDMHILNWSGGTSTPTYNWTTFDAIIDTVRSCGLQPIMELDFMPPNLQSNGVISKPKNWNIWQGLIAAIVSHCETRYGAAEVRTWYWEVWNEYDYAGFWNGTVNDYDTLFSRTVAGVRSVDTLIKIGGPATTTSSPLDSFVTYCKNSGTKFNFLSNHFYGGAPGNTSDPVNIRNDNRTRSQVISARDKSLFSLNTEYNTTYTGQGGNTDATCVSMDSHINAAFIAKTTKLVVADCIGGAYRFPDVLSYWTLSDCFDESGGSYIENHNKVPFGQVFGLITYQGIRKAAFNAYKMLHMMGTTGLSLTGGSGDADGVDGFATVNADSSQVAILIYDYYKDFTATSANNTVNITINRLPFTVGNSVIVRHYRVDSMYSNPYAVWVKQGKPTTPSTAQWDSLRAHQNLADFEAQSSITYTGAAINKSFTIPRFGVSLLTFSQTPNVGVMVQPVAHPHHLSIKGTMLTVNNLQSGPVNILICSANGRLIKKYGGMQRSFDLSIGLVKGLYIVNAEASGVGIVKKILVQ